jgi:hypothetical protein
MTQQPIDDQLATGSLVVPHIRGHAVAFVAVVLAAAIFVGYAAAQNPMGIWWAVGLLAVALFAYSGLVVAFDAARGVPLLRASDSGVAINSPLGRMFVAWLDTEEFTQGVFDWWLRIRLREGAPPAGSFLTRILSASLWARSAIAVPLFTTGKDAVEISKALTQLRSRKLGLKDPSAAGLS